MQVILTTNQGGKLIDRELAREYVTGRSTREFAAKIELWACRTFGRMDSGDWRMVNDPDALVPMYARDRYGDTITLR